MIHNRHEFDCRLVDNLTKGIGTAGAADFDPGVDIMPDAGVVGAIDFVDEILDEMWDLAGSMVVKHAINVITYYTK